MALLLSLFIFCCDDTSLGTLTYRHFLLLSGFFGVHCIDMVPAAGCQAHNFRGSVDVKVLLSSYTWVFWSLFSMPPPILLFDVRWCTSPGVLAGHVFHFSPSLGVSWSLVFGSVFFLHSWFDGFSWCTGSMLSFFVWCYGRWLFFLFGIFYIF